MPLSIGAEGLVGVAFEATAGTYAAPTKYIPINSESLHIVEETQRRRPIRQNADIIGAVAGNEHAEGDIEMEALEDCLIYFLYAARTSVNKSGSTPNFTYAVTPRHTALPTTARTLSITIVRSGQVFAYTGCVVSSFGFGIDNGMLTFRASIIGRAEATQSSPTATWPSTVPFAMGQYSIEIPTATPVTDTDTFEFTRNDNGEAQFRLKSTGRTADFVKFGEGESTLNLSRDFLTRTDYDAFKAITSQSITLSATKGANNSVTILMPVAYKDTYETGLSGQGDLLRASISYFGTIDGSGNSYTVTVKTQEDIT